MKLSVIIPAYNESKVIARTIEETIDVIKELNCKYEIIVVDDGSVDNTSEIVDSIAKSDNKNLKLVKNSLNIGKGWSVREGFYNATGDLVVFLDADLNLHPKMIKDFLSIMERDGSDAVIGSKRHKESKTNYPLHRKILSTGYYILSRILFNLPVKDTQTGLKILNMKF